MPPSPHMNGKFVCFSGRLQGETTLSDDLFPFIQVDRALLLLREIEIYQYVQVDKGDNKYELKEEWCKSPQKDPSKFEDKKNSNGNWELFADNSRMVDTGHTLYGEKIQFGDNIVVFRGPNISIGEFAIPLALMNEAFLGERYVHRLGELELIKESQGKWESINLEQKCHLNPQSVELVLQGVYHAYQEGPYIYDAPKNQIGTIRFQWRFVKPQDMTVAAEAVAPGRVYMDGYGSAAVRNVGEKGAMRKIIFQDLAFGFQEEQCPLLPNQEQQFGCSDKWTVTPFSVSSKHWLPPHDEKFLGRLWLCAPELCTSRRLFKRAHRASSRCLWKLRGLSYVLLFVGWCLVFEPLTNIFRVPVLRSLLSLAFASFAFVLATTCCLSCTALARVTARPMQSILLIATVWVLVVELQNKLEENEYSG